MQAGIGTYRNRIALVLVGIVALVAISAALLVKNWPFTKESLTATLEHRFARQVTIGTFRRTYFPPGCVADDISFLHRKRKDLPPLITVKKLVVEGSYSGLIGTVKHVPNVVISGLRITVPPRTPDGQHSVMPLTDNTSQLVIAHVDITDAILSFINKNRSKPPYVVPIHRLILQDLGDNRPVPFQASLKNMEPPGDIQTKGQFGPWDQDDPGASRVSGSYSFEKANLGVFDGISGTLASTGKFSGSLGHLDCEGHVAVPNFELSGSGLKTPLSTNYQATVNATDGDVILKNVDSSFLQTGIAAFGSVVHDPKLAGRVVVVKFNVGQGRVEDLLRLVTNEHRPSLTGAVRLLASVKFRPQGPGFLRSLNVDGDFGVAGERFANPGVERPMTILADHALGKKAKDFKASSEAVLSNLKGHLSVQDGIATLSNVWLEAPGTMAEIRGTYNLLDHRVNLQGILHTTGSLADTTSGFKAVMLKVISPFLKKKSVTVVPFTIRGTAANPVFALDLDGKRSF